MQPTKCILQLSKSQTNGMKKLFLLILVTTFGTSSFAQMKESSYAKTLKQDYLRKSRNQRTTGFILLGAGTALTITGYLIISNNQVEDYLNPLTVVESGAGAGVATIGMLTAVASIPFFILSYNNNKRAKNMSAGLKMEKLLQEKIKTSYPTYFPAVTASISF
jgi:hypothetical protein